MLYEDLNKFKSSLSLDSIHLSVFIYSDHRWIHWSLMLESVSFVWLVDYCLCYFSDFFFFLLAQHVHQVPSSQPKVRVFVCSALPIAVPHLRLPLSACAVMDTTVGMLISQMNPAPVSVLYVTLYSHTVTTPQ